MKKSILMVSLLFFVSAVQAGETIKLNGVTKDDMKKMAEFEKKQAEDARKKAKKARKIAERKKQKAKK
jgi:hypothetical protein